MAYRFVRMIGSGLAEVTTPQGRTIRLPVPSGSNFKANQIVQPKFNQCCQPTGLVLPGVGSSSLKTFRDVLQPRRTNLNPAMRVVLATGIHLHWLSNLITNDPDLSVRINVALNRHEHIYYDPFPVYPVFELIIHQKAFYYTRFKGLLKPDNTGVIISYGCRNGYRPTLVSSPPNYQVLRRMYDTPVHRVTGSLIVPGTSHYYDDLSLSPISVKSEDIIPLFMYLEQKKIPIPNEENFTSDFTTKYHFFQENQRKPDTASDSKNIIREAMSFTDLIKLPEVTNAVSITPFYRV